MHERVEDGKPHFSFPLLSFVSWVSRRVLRARSHLTSLFNVSHSFGHAVLFSPFDRLYVSGELHIFLRLWGRRTL